MQRERVGRAEDGIGRVFGVQLGGEAARGTVSGQEQAEAGAIVCRDEIGRIQFQGALATRSRPWLSCFDL